MEWEDMVTMAELGNSDSSSAAFKEHVRRHLETMDIEALTMLINLVSLTPANVGSDPEFFTAISQRLKAAGSSNMRTLIRLAWLDENLAVAATGDYFNKPAGLAC